ncbi:MAG: hypothetical protein ACD_4C00405G0001, partial [uncultured bacterium (gcode 4)]
FFIGKVLYMAVPEDDRWNSNYTEFPLALQEFDDLGKLKKQIAYNLKIYRIFQENINVTFFPNLSYIAPQWIQLFAIVFS